MNDNNKLKIEIDKEPYFIDRDSVSLSKPVYIFVYNGNEERKYKIFLTKNNKLRMEKAD